MDNPDSPCPASHRRCIERISQTWQTFLATRSDRLRHGGETEKVAEAITEDLFTGVLDWSKGDLMYQVGYADIVISNHLAKYLVIEVKRPGMLFPGRWALENAIAQARRYAGEQKIPSVAATDGRYLYAADVAGGGLTDRVMVDLSSADAPVELWKLRSFRKPPCCLRRNRWRSLSIRNTSCRLRASRMYRMPAGRRPGSCHTAWGTVLWIPSVFRKLSRRSWVITAGQGWGASPKVICARC